MEQNRYNYVVETAVEMGKSAAKGAALITGGAIAVKGVAAVALPTVMSWTGTVVAGTGTIHGTATASVAAFAAAPVALPVVIIGGVVGGVYSYRSKL
jgi:hypothetical protein